MFISSVLAFWISALCGGGASLVIIPALNSILPLSVVPFSLTIGTFTSSASRILFFNKHVKWKIFIWFTPFSIPAVLLGAYLIKLVNPTYLQAVVALFLIANIPQLLISRKKQEKEEKPYPNSILAAVGFFAGFISGITGAIGLLFNRFYLKYGLSKEEIIATRAANEIFLHAIKIIIYILLGLYSVNAVWAGITIASAAIISSYTVKYILPYLSEFIFRKIGYGAMAVSGIVLLSGASEKIIKQDNISWSVAQNGDESEATIQWRQSAFILEYAYDGGLEIERPIKSDELPPALKIKYEKLSSEYNQILLEKVFSIGSSSYEFYCEKDKVWTKFEFEE